MADSQSSSKATSQSSKKLDEYILSTVIDAHKAEVRAVDSSEDGSLLVTGGREEHVFFWKRRGRNYDKVQTLDLAQGKSVHSIAIFEDANGWQVFVGQKDGAISVYASGSSQPVQCHRVHKHCVCFLGVDKVGRVLMSSSWDSTAIIWPIDEIRLANFSANQITGHTASVWAMAAVPESVNLYLTASADKTIKLWRTDVEQATFTGHKDVVRALCAISPDRFLSASNDSTVRLWSIGDKSCLRTFNSVCDEYIYSMKLIDLDSWITVGENGTVELWKVTTTADAQAAELENILTTAPTDLIRVVNKQVLKVPAASAWDTTVLPNRDLAVASSDGKVYVYTEDERRKADDATIATVETLIVDRATALLAANAVNDSKETTIKVSLDDGPNQLDLVYKHGTDPMVAATEFCTNNGLPTSYVGEIIDFIKKKVPEANASNLPRPSEDERVPFNGQMYDYVWEMVTEEGHRIPIPFNVGDDPDSVSMEVCGANQLPVKYMPQIAGLIRQQATKASSRRERSFQDPLTGSGRYVPDDVEMTPVEFSDPLTGGGRYVPGASSGADSALSGDPLTAGGRYIPGTSSNPGGSQRLDPRRPRGEGLPLERLILFTSVPNVKAIEKLSAGNAALDEQHRLDDAQLAQVVSLLTAGDPSQVADPNEDAEVTCAALQKTLANWPSDLALLPVLDALRMALLHEKYNRILCRPNGVMHDRLRAILLPDQNTPDALRLLACRAVANATSHPAGQELFCSSELTTITALLANQVLGGSTGQIQATAASALANISYTLLERSNKVAEIGPREDMLRGLVQALETDDAVMRFGSLDQTALGILLQALATCMWGDSTVIKLAQSKSVSKISERIKDAVQSESAKHIARSITNMTLSA